jgi:hypothetical protein
MKTKYKEAGVEFRCFRNRGHPERWSPRKITDFNAPERVAVPSDEIAERVGMHMTELQEVPYIPARKNWTAAFRGGGIVLNKALRRQMTKMAKIRQVFGTSFFLNFDPSTRKNVSS